MRWERPKGLAGRVVEGWGAEKDRIVGWRWQKSAPAPLPSLSGTKGMCPWTPELWSPSAKGLRPRDTPSGLGLELSGVPPAPVPRALLSHSASLVCLPSSFSIAPASEAFCPIIKVLNSPAPCWDLGESRVHSQFCVCLA